MNQAEELKRCYGFVMEEKYLDLDQAKVKVPLGYDGAVVDIETYSTFDILQPRAEEVLEMLYDEIVEYRLRSMMPSGLVLTGGG